MARTSKTPKDQIQHLNYLYRLTPDEAQMSALDETMRLTARWWNLHIKAFNVAMRFIKKNQESKVKALCQEMMLAKNDVAKRAEKFVKAGLVQKFGKKQAEEIIAKKPYVEYKALLNADEIAAGKLIALQGDFDILWNKSHGAGLARDFACLKADQMKHGSAGSQRAVLFKDVRDKFEKSWKAVFDSNKDPSKPKCNAPRKKKVGVDATSAGIQTQKPVEKVILSGNDRDNKVDLSAFFPERLNGAEHAHMHKVPFIMHRPLPPGAIIKGVKLIRSNTRDFAIWKVVFTLDVIGENRASVMFDFPKTDKVCGIDPGRSTPITLGGDANEHWTAGVDKPYAAIKDRLARLQRHYDRQQRANNPQCFNIDGTWKKGEKPTVFSKGMKETLERISELAAYCKDFRADQYSKFAHQVLRNFDVVYFGNWKDSSPESRRKLKAKRKQEFKQGNITRSKGQAARERTQNAADRDAAVTSFRNMLVEKAGRSLTTPKSVAIVNEGAIKSTQTCSVCFALTGPKNDTSIREWNCEKCGTHHVRDHSSAMLHWIVPTKDPSVISTWLTPPGNAVSVQIGNRSNTTTP